MKKNNFLGLIPLLVFITVFLGSGIINKDFYALPSPISAVLGIVVAFLLFKGNVSDKVNVFLKGCGDYKILTMCIIYLLAGAFATVSKTIGSIESIVNISMAYIAPQYLAVGVFVMASFLSFSSGTSVGSIVTLAPVVIELAEQSHSPLPLVGAALLCGAMFGDNLSIISDTTIAATQSLNCKMNEKLKANIKLAIPAAFFSIILFLIMGNSEAIYVLAEQQSYNWLLILPYCLVIILAFLGVNVFVNLFIGILFSGFLGLMFGSFDLMGWAKSTYEGFTGMTEIFLLSLLTGGLAAMVEKAGGIQYLLDKISSFIKNKKSALLGIGSLVGAVNLAVANNTISILISGKIAKEISDKYALHPKNSASILDVFSCYIQGIIPYGAQILILISLSDFKIDYIQLLLHSYYLHALFVIAIVFILFSNLKKI